MAIASTRRSSTAASSSTALRTTTTAASSSTALRTTTAVASCSVRLSKRKRQPIARFVAEPAPDPHTLRVAVRESLGSRVLPSELSNAALERAILTVEELAIDSPGFEDACDELRWEHIDAWANMRQRVVVRKWQLRRLLDFTDKLLLVRHTDGSLAGCALLSEAPDGSDLCGTLDSRRNPSLPLVRTARMAQWGSIRAAHVRAAFSRVVHEQPLDELILICGERGVGSTIMAHLRGRPRLLFASVVPGCDRTRRFYDSHFAPLPFERHDGEVPYVAWLGEAKRRPTPHYD